MTKFRKILIALLSLVMIASFSAFAVGCDDGNSGDADLTLTIQEKTSEIEIGETGLFVAKVDGVDEATVIWSSTDGSILSISPSGEYEAKTLGTVTVTASYAGDSKVKDTMSVTVKKSNVGVLSVEDYNYSIMIGNTSQLNPYVLYNSKKYSDGVTFTYSSDNESVALVDSNGLITAIGEGNAVIEIKTNFRNDSISTLIDIAVKGSNFISIFAPQNRNSTIYTLDYDNHITGFTYTYEVYEGSQKVQDPTVTWTSSDEEVATVVDGKVEAIATGVTTITATYIDTQGVTHIDVDKVYVAKPSFDTEKLIEGYLVGKTFDLPVVDKYPDFERSNVENITFNGVVALNQDWTLNKDVVIGSPDKYRELVVSTAKADYRIKVRVTNAIVKNLLDLTKVEENLAVCKVNPLDELNTSNNKYLNGIYYDGYVEFAKDINMQGFEDFKGIATKTDRAQYEAQVGKKNGFRGTIDGKGFTIKNATFTNINFIKHVGSGAVIKDLKFDNITVSGKNSGVFGKIYGGATFEGIDIKGQIDVTGSYDKDSGQGLIFSAILGTDVKFEKSTIWLTNESVALIDSKNFVSVFGSFSQSNAYDFASIFGEVTVVSSSSKLLSTNVASPVVYTAADLPTVNFYSGEINYYLANGWEKDQSSTEANCYQEGHYTLTRAGEQNKEYTIEPLGHSLVNRSGEWVCENCQRTAKVVNVVTDVKSGLTAQLIDSEVDPSVGIAYVLNGNDLPCAVKSNKLGFMVSDPVAYTNDETLSTLTVALTDGSAYLVHVDLYSLIVKTANDFLAMYNYLDQIDATHCDGRFIFEENVEIDMDGKSWKQDSSFHTSTATLYGGFQGTIDGNGAKVKNLTLASTSTAYSLIDIAYGCTIKNLSLQVTNSQYGIIARRVARGITLENVTVELTTDTVSIEWDKTNGVLLDFLCMSGNVNLTNVTFIYSGPATDKLANASLIAGTQPAYSTHSYDYKGTVNVDNLVVVGLGNANALPFNGPQYVVSTDPEFDGSIATPFGLGNGCEVVGSKGITIYKTVEDYNNKENAYEMTNTVLTDITGVNAKDKLDLASLTASEGDTLARVKVYHNYAFDKSDVTRKGLVIIPGEEGEYVYYFIMDDYKTYTVKVIAAPAIPLEEVTISDTFNFDLKDGFNVNDILSAAGQDPDTIETITIGGQVFEADDQGLVDFGDPAEMALAVKMLPKDGAQTVILTGAKQYNLVDFHLYSIIVSDSDEMRLMSSYQAVGTDKMVYGVYAFDADIEFSGEWTATHTIAKSNTIASGGFNGVIDGCGHKIHNFENQNQWLIYFAYKCTIKNITFDFDQNNFHGLAQYATGCNVSDVTIISHAYSSGAKGALFGELCGNSGNTDDIKLTNVTFINDFNPSSANSGKTFDNGQALVGAIYVNSASYLFKANIVIDNVIVVSTGANLPVLKFVTATYRYGGSLSEKVFDLGSGVQVAPGGKGVTYYSSLDDYDNEQNGIVATTREVIDVDATVGGSVDFASKLDSGDTFDYLFTGANDGNIVVKKYQKGTPSTFTFTEAGVFFVSVRTTNFHYYTFRVTVK